MNFLFKSLEVGSRWQIPYDMMVAFRLSYLVLTFYFFSLCVPLGPSVTSSGLRNNYLYSSP